MNLDSFVNYWKVLRFIADREKNLTLKYLISEYEKYDDYTDIKLVVDTLIEDGFLFIKPYKILKDMKSDTEYKIILSQKAKDHLELWDVSSKEYVFKKLMSNKKCPFGSFSGKNKYVSNLDYYKIEQLLKQAEEMGFQENYKITTAGRFMYLEHKVFLFLLLDDYVEGYHGN